MLLVSLVPQWLRSRHSVPLESQHHILRIESEKAYKKSSTTVDTSLFSNHIAIQQGRLTGLVHHSLHWHMSHTLQLVVDD
jgi:hypothetical protein